MLSLAANAALLVIDVQVGFLDAHWGARNNPHAEVIIAQLLSAWRQAGRPVIHVQHDSLSPNSSFRAGTPGNVPKAEAQPLSTEPVYHKTVNSAFIGTTLEADLRRAGIGELVVVGLTTQHCVSTTTRMAGNLGFAVYVVENATAAFDQVSIVGHTRPAQEVHTGALSDLSGEFATVVTSAQVLSALHCFEPRSG